ncbi:hypothetical protein [Arthrobacter sp. NPDC090010]|uniref:hypothetical protein n=1 Tax=Arthrobacter sp. NPDC090010 TaxID=3363942 RepID=UPI0038299C19
MRRTKYKGRTPDLFHGGRAGLRAGDILIPGLEQPDMGLQWLPAAFLEEYSPEWVYVTTDIDLARDYAGVRAQIERLWSGALYKVAIIGPQTEDPDYPTGISYRCYRAKILNVLDEDVPPSISVTGAALNYQTWDDGSPLYDHEGYPLPNQVGQFLGVTAEDLRDLGYGARFRFIERRQAQLIHRTFPGMNQAKMNELITQVTVMKRSSPGKLRGGSCYRGA